MSNAIKAPHFTVPMPCCRRLITLCCVYCGDGVNTGDSNAVGDHRCVFLLLGTQMDSERTQATSSRHTVHRPSIPRHGKLPDSL